MPGSADVRERETPVFKLLQPGTGTESALPSKDIGLDIAVAVDTPEAPVKSEGRTRRGRDNKENIEVP